MRKESQIHRVVGLAFFVGLASMEAEATLLPYKDLAALVAESDGIVMGTVRAVESRRGAKQEIYTFVTLEQLEVLNGRTERDTLVLRLQGGEVDSEVLELHGSPQFRRGERVLLFLQGNGRQIVPLVGWTQGVFRVSRDAQNGLDVVTDHEGNRLFGVQGDTLDKERRFASEAAIIGAPPPLSSTDSSLPVPVSSQKAGSKAADAGGGTTENNVAVEKKTQPEKSSLGRKSMNVRAFVDIVKQKVQEQGKKNLLLNSLDDLAHPGQPKQ